MPCTQFDAPCFQLVQQNYTKLELLVIMRLLESNIAYHQRKTYAPNFKGKHLIGELLQIHELISFRGHLVFNKDFFTEITFWPRHMKEIWWKERMCPTWKFKLRKYYLCEKREQLLKKCRNIKISKYQNSQ